MFISRNGIPNEILTDQDNNFMSGLFTQLKNKLEITGIRATPYHSLCNGLVERMNAIIKVMIK